MTDDLIVMQLTEYAALLGWDIMTVRDEDTMAVVGVMMGTEETVYYVMGGEDV